MWEWYIIKTCLFVRIDKSDIEYIWSEQNRNQTQYKKEKKQTSSALDFIISTTVREAKKNQKQRKKRMINKTRKFNNIENSQETNLINQEENQKNNEMELLLSDGEIIDV